MKPGHEEPLIFNWPGHGHVSLALPGFIILSVILHAATFLVFRIVYPVSATILKPPAQLTLVTPANEAGRAFLRWLDTQDPTALTRTPEIMPPSLLDLPYRPSYADMQTQPVMVDEHRGGTVYPPVRSPLSLIGGSRQAAPALPEPATAPQTTVLFTGGLAHRGLNEHGAIKLQARTAAALAPARFLVCVNARGEIRNSFLQTSSGSSDIDREAAQQLAGLMFEPADAAFTWGFATFHWGADAFAPAAPPRP
jgi:hypothetical protein